MMPKRMGLLELKIIRARTAVMPMATSESSGGSYAFGSSHSQRASNSLFVTHHQYPVSNPTRNSNARYKSLLKDGGSDLILRISDVKKPSPRKTPRSRLDHRMASRSDLVRPLSAPLCGSYIMRIN